jgi:DNA-binding transcriptional regulator GbsR (MarR family)
MTPTESSHAQDFIERLGRLAEGEGLPRTAGRMMALLMLDENALSIDDLAGELQVSRASVSTNGRLLESLHIARRVTRPGDRRDYLQITAEPCMSLLSLGLRRLNDMRSAVRDMREASPRTRRGGQVRERLAKVEELYDLAIARAESALEEWQRQHAKSRK